MLTEEPELVHSKSATVWILNAVLLLLKNATWKHEIFMTRTKKPRCEVEDKGGQKVGCQRGDGAEIFSRLKLLVPKCIRVQKQWYSLFWLFGVGELEMPWILSMHITHQNNHVCLFSPAHRLVESARNWSRSSYSGRVAKVLVLKNSVSRLVIPNSW